MTDQSSIFNQNQNQATPEDNGGGNPPNTNNSDPIATLLSQIRNERGEPKYKNLDDALNALKHSQEYIPELSQKLKDQERDLVEARAAASKVAELEAVVRNLTHPSSIPSNTQTTSLTEERVAELVNSSLTKAEQEKVAKGNIQSVAQSVAAKFGAEAEKIFYGKAQELGLSVAEFNALAAKTPKAVLGLLGITDTAVQHTSKQSAPGTVLNTAGNQPQTETLVGKNKIPTLVGATTQQLKEESARARQMVDELHAQGKTVHDLTDPKVYFKHFS